MNALSRETLGAHARDWLAAWNAHDIEAVLAPFAEDARFVSPMAAELTGNARIEGRAALRRYWTGALARLPDLRFEPVATVIDMPAQTLSVLYRAHAGGRLRDACEVMQFRDGRQILGRAYYGATT